MGKYIHRDGGKGFLIIYLSIYKKIYVEKIEKGEVWSSSKLGEKKGHIKNYSVII